MTKETTMPMLVGVQLWTLRDELDDLPALCAAVAAAGVQAVEPFGLGDPDVAAPDRVARASAMRRAAEAEGLRIVSTHIHLPASADADALVDEMAALGARTALAALPEELSGFDRDAFADLDSIDRWAGAMNALAERVRGAGLRVGYHNHFWEWNALPGGGLAYDRLWEVLSPEVVAEVDVLWARYAGQDPVEIVERLGSRVRLLHVGDAAPVTNADHQVAAGDGEAPLDAAMRAGAETVEAVFIEASTPPPGVTPMDLVARSAAWLSARIADLAAVPAADAPAGRPTEGGVA